MEIGSVGQHAGQADLCGGAVVSFITRRLGLVPIDGADRATVDVRYYHAFMGCETVSSVGAEIWLELENGVKQGHMQITVDHERLSFMESWLHQSVSLASEMVEHEGLQQEAQRAREDNAARQLVAADEWVDDLPAELVVLEALLAEVKTARSRLGVQQGQQHGFNPRPGASCSMSKSLALA